MIKLIFSKEQITRRWWPFQPSFKERWSGSGGQASSAVPHKSLQWLTQKTNHECVWKWNGLASSQPLAQSWRFSLLQGLGILWRQMGEDCHLLLSHPGIASQASPLLQTNEQQMKLWWVHIFLEACRCPANICWVVKSSVFKPITSWSQFIKGVYSSSELIVCCQKSLSAQTR